MRIESASRGLGLGHGLGFDLGPSLYGRLHHRSLGHQVAGRPAGWGKQDVCSSCLCDYSYTFLVGSQMGFITQPMKGGQNSAIMVDCVLAEDSKTSSSSIMSFSWLVIMAA